ncbi:MAG: hypothetical protein Q4G40_07830 [Brachybacterium sp.]|nr:hypothetical protein [Brachybacterium sp.]
MDERPTTEDQASRRDAPARTHRRGIPWGLLLGPVLGVGIGAILFQHTGMGMVMGLVLGLLVGMVVDTLRRGAPSP